jgi:CRISPR-associated endoribonuclease Cas6
VIGSILVSIEPTGDASCPGLGGEAVHALFYTVLQAKLPELAARLHQPRGELPFSISPLMGCPVRQGYCCLYQGEKAAFRITFLQEELLTAAISAFFNAAAADKAFDLCGTQVRIREVVLSGNKLVSFSSFEKIVAEAQPENTLTFEFASPTCFKSERVQLLFPEPRLVFSSLLRKWNAFSPVKLPAELAESFASIKVASFNLRTQLVRFSRYKIIGSTGRITYALPKDSSHLAALNALADFAFYCGTGAKTTMGMGQTRRLK